jgi:A/G-specific adenine glycosylase
MSFSQQIISWYHQNKRELPWRDTKDPYKIWLSEIILQQTRVEQGKPYYYAFVEKFPKVEDLANAHQDEVLKLWQGLGYYSRARNLHFAAQQVLNDFNGVFPDNYNDLIKLKGVGEYTAAAIASFAFNENKAVVDGNVYRVLARFLGIETPIDSSQGKKEFQIAANELIDEKQPANFNQAIMEFGAMQCVPASPNCENCPLAETCFAFNNNKISELPFKEKKIKQKHRYFNYFIISDVENIIIQKRGASDIWENLFELPLLETAQKIEDLSIFKTHFNTTKNIVPLFELKHILTHRIINSVFYKIDLENLKDFNLIEKQQLVKMEELNTFAFPKLIDNAFLKLGLY